MLMTLALAALFAAAAANEPARVPVELWTGGDDALTQRFAAAVRGAIAASATFDSAAAGQGKLRMEIPTHLYWQKAQERIHFQYVVILVASDGRYVGNSIGGCWESDMDDCANRVVADASAAWAARQ
jgi:hypothetical protein